ncbi:hypothetical protein SAMN05892877_119103 [Rhizobium subbaraonis]|uniref:Uncharacterized protein n=1 Tax=Rhizobium subbaraonis TaxID=908946 RepID=A0A285UVZ0_9HYPH|nr:hypothetical protein SAMN05892877_119103 [Rhizobium subbaraonis]
MIGHRRSDAAIRPHRVLADRLLTTVMPTSIDLHRWLPETQLAAIALARSDSDSVEMPWMAAYRITAGRAFNAKQDKPGCPPLLKQEHGPHTTRLRYDAIGYWHMAAWAVETKSRRHPHRTRTAKVAGRQLLDISINRTCMLRANGIRSDRPHQRAPLDNASCRVLTDAKPASHSYFCQSITHKIASRARQ